MTRELGGSQDSIVLWKPGTESVSERGCCQQGQVLLTGEI